MRYTAICAGIEYPGTSARSAVRSALFACGDRPVLLFFHSDPVRAHDALDRPVCPDPVPCDPGPWIREWRISQ